MTARLRQALVSGRYDHDWSTVVGTVDGEVVELRVSSDALKVEGVREVGTPRDIALVCEALGAVAPIPWVLDLRFLQSDIKNEPQPKHYPGGRGMGTARAIREHSQRVDASIEGQFGALIGNVGKHWMWPLSLEQLYAWHVWSESWTWRGIRLHPAVSGYPHLKVIQPLSKAHTGADLKIIEPTHEDYSMTVVVVGSVCKVAGIRQKTEDVYRETRVWGMAA